MIPGPVMLSPVPLNSGPAPGFAQEAPLQQDGLWGSHSVSKKLLLSHGKRSQVPVGISLLHSAVCKWAVLQPTINLAVHFPELLEENALSSKISRPLEFQDHS